MAPHEVEMKYVFLTKSCCHIVGTAQMCRAYNVFYDGSSLSTAAGMIGDGHKQIALYLCSWKAAFFLVRCIL